MKLVRIVFLASLMASVTLPLIGCSDGHDDCGGHTDDVGECEQVGGTCSGIGDCLEAGDYFTSTGGECGGSPSIICCVPKAQCGEETIECCMGSWVARPTCDDGKLVCAEGGTPVPKGTCEVP